MNLLSLFTRSPSAQHLHRVAQTIAGRVRHTVWQRVSHRSPSMSKNEARGYIRARAATIVDREVDQAIHRDRHLNASHHDKIANSVLDAIVAMIEVQTRVTHPQTNQAARVA